MRATRWSVMWEAARRVGRWTGANKSSSSSRSLPMEAAKCVAPWRGSGRYGDSELVNGTVERGRDVDVDARDGAVVTSHQKRRRPQRARADIEAFVWKSTALRDASNGVDRKG